MVWMVRAPCVTGGVGCDPEPKPILPLRLPTSAAARTDRLTSVFERKGGETPGGTGRAFGPLPERDPNDPSTLLKSV